MARSCDYTALEACRTSADEKDGPMSKERLGRVVSRDVRLLSKFSFTQAVSWIVWVTWPVFLFQSVFACINVYLNAKHGWTVHHNLLMLHDGYRPYLLATLQLMSAFLTGLAVNDAVVRFKTALSALIGFKNALEGLRTQLLASTEDPKLEVAVQVLLAMAVVLLNKEIAFFTKDYSRPVLEHLSTAHTKSDLFAPEVLWTFTKMHWKFLVQDFLTHSKMSDSHLQNVFKELVDSWNRLEEMIIVKSPNTRHQLTRAVVQLFFFVVPLFNEDLITQVMVPVVAALFVAMIEFAQELADPWGNDHHSMPLNDMLKYLAWPVDTEGSTEAAVDEAIKWMNKGLRGPAGGNSETVDEKDEKDEKSTAKHWETLPGVEPKFPRKKRFHPNAGEEITFNGMRTIPQIANRKDWDTFIAAVKDDMKASELRGRDMPVWLRAGRE